jgi:Tfp pilus assembly protein PilO
MRVSTKRILSIGLAGVFLVGAFVVYAKFISTYMDEVNEKRAAIASKEAAYNNQNSAVKQVQSTIAQFQNFQDIQSKISLAVPNGIQTIQALRQIEAIASRTNSTISSISFKTASSRASKATFLKKIGVLDVSLSVVGGYGDLKQFLSLVETNARVANVQEFKFQPGMNTKAGTDQLTVKLEMYYQEL